MIYPISFTKNMCCACGSAGTLRFEQENGSIVKDPIYSITSIVCEKCNTKYFIKWIPKGMTDNAHLIPITTSTDTIDKFEKEIIEYSQRYKRKLDFGGLA